MIRLANELDLPAVAAIYEAILDHEDATGIHYTGWQRGTYPTADTARSIFDAGTLYVGVDETGSVWGSMNLNGQQLPEYQNGAWTISAEDRQVAIIHTLTIDPARAGSLPGVRVSEDQVHESAKGNEHQQGGHGGSLLRLPLRVGALSLFVFRPGRLRAALGTFFRFLVHHSIFSKVILPFRLPCP